MHNPIQWRDPFAEMMRRVQPILDSVAGAALPIASDAAPKVAMSPAMQEPREATIGPKGKLKKSLVLGWLKSLPLKAMSDADARLSRDGYADEADRQQILEHAAIDVREATPSRLRKMLEGRGLLDGYTYTQRSANKMIRLLIAKGELPGWTGGRAAKAPRPDDSNVEHDVDAEFGVRGRHRSDEDEGESPGMAIRNRLHRSGEPSKKKTRRPGKPSRDEMAVAQFSDISDEHRAAAAAFWQEHPELEEG
jgi:hypothetical protein